MNTPTYKEQYDKIIDAYFDNEIQPCDPQFCFCGTLCNNRYSWQDRSFRQRFHYYSLEEYGKMEKALFSAWPNIEWIENGEIVGYIPKDNYEENLFNGMCAALEVLKQIHISKGETIDETPTFTKRELQKV